MAILSDINAELGKMGAAQFQELGDELLYAIYNPINIESRGSKEGQVKTKKGSPDTIFTIPTGKILIEYTTQSNRPQNSFIRKLKGDITSCLDVKKTKIPLTEIVEIVLFSNQRIATDIQDDLRATLLSQYPYIKLTIFAIDDVAIKLRDYPELLRTYLGISLFPGLVEIDSFIKRFSCKKFSYLTPLDNTFFEFETLPISKGLEILKTTDIIIISGEPGMGKTRYAVEIAKAYSNIIGAKVFVIEEKNRSAREILDYIDKNSSYIFIIDDANRTAIWDEDIEFYETSPSNNVKFIATVRSYARDSVLDKCSKCLNSEEIVMSETPEELASRILTSFGITNHLWHKRINDITGRNIRLAVMCAQIAMAGEKFNELLNVEGIYDAYYKPTFISLNSDSTDCIMIRAIAIISFYKVVDLEDDSLLKQIEEIFGFQKDEFISICHKLDTLECISVTEYNVVTISDQNWGTYIFYKCFYVLKELDLSNLIEKLYHRRERLRDSIFAVWNCFHKKEVINFTRTAISQAWKRLSISLEDREKCEFLEVFGGAIPEITFPYIKHLIQEVTIKNNNPSSIGSDSIISILSQFSHSEESTIATALFLMVEFLKVTPNAIDKVSKIVSEHWLYDEIDYTKSYKRETVIIDTLISLSETSEIGFLFASLILPGFLKFIYQYTRTRGRRFVFGRNAVVITDELKANRIKVWMWINHNMSKINQADFIRDLYNDFYEVKSIAKTLIKDEIHFLNICISGLNISEDFNVCKNLAGLGKRVKDIIGKDSVQIDWNLANPLYSLECQIRKGCERKNIRAYEVEYKNIGRIVVTQDLPQLKRFVDDLSLIADLKNIKNDYRISYAIENSIELYPEKGLKLWEYCIEQKVFYSIFRIVSVYYRMGYDLAQLLCFANNQKRNLKADIVLAFVCIFDNPSQLISEQCFCEAIKYHESESYTIDELCKKFYSVEQYLKRSRSIMAAILHRVRSGLSISGTEEFLLNFCERNQSAVNIVGYTYINGLSHQDSYDYKHDLLKCILQLNSEFWVECCKAIPTFAKTYHINSYDFIWSLENYSKIIESALVYYSSMSWIPFDEKENLFSFFCNIKGSQASVFIDQMIKKYCNNRDVSNKIFEIVSTSMGSSRTQHFTTFITQNPNIEDFKRLDLFPDSMYGGDSFAPAVKSRLDFIESLIVGIRNLKERINYLDHIQYLSECKQSLERQYKHELKSGHKHRLYDL